MPVAIPLQDADRARDAEKTFLVQPSLYLIGSLEDGVNLYSQQVRAHNLAWSLWQMQRDGGRRLGRVAVVGGGATGLTFTACVLALFDKSVKVTLFERLWDLCPVQQGCDARWLHPRIYGWPFAGSRAPSASLPVLNWSEGRASDVARTLLQEFALYIRAFAEPNERLAVYLGLRNFEIDHASGAVTWVGHRAAHANGFFHASQTEGATEKFDTIVLAAGFGAERQVDGYPTEPYWRNEQLAQPALDGQLKSYLISGFGDGALVDLCRISIERFRQDTIVYELFGDDLEATESRFANELDRAGPDANIYELLQSTERELFTVAKNRLSERLRKDSHLTLHLQGRKGNVKTFDQIFGRTSSVLHRVLTYLLFRCGAFAVDFSDLGNAASRHGVVAPNILCRHGADTIGHLQALFSDASTLTKRFIEMKTRQQQSPRQLWAPGTFPHYSSR